MIEDIKDIEEILELAKEELENNDENINATLDLQDLKSLKKLYELYQEEKEKNKELEENLKIATAMLTKGTYPEQNEGDNNFNKQFIQTSKVIEKIEKLDKEITPNFTSIATLKRIFARDILEELLQDKE